VLEHVVLVDGAEDGTVALDRLEDMGASSFDFDATWRAVEPDDVLTLIYTSGTTGPPKGVQLTHHNLMAEIRAVADRLPTIPGGRITSFLPSAHIADRWSAHYQSSMVFGFTLTSIADARAVVQHLPEVRPTAWGSVPRIWEKLKAALEAQGVTDPAALPEEHRAAIREKLGLDQCAWLVVGAAPTPREVLGYFAALGLPICELWGMSETSSCATINPPDRIKIGTCGPALQGVELKLADDGELLVRGEIVMPGYRNDPQKTAEAFDDDGWLRTGDVAEIDDDGYVKIVDRKKELIINAAGKNMSPVNIESRLKTCHPLIGTAVAIGDRRPYNVALIVLDPDACGAFASQHGIEDGSPAALAGDDRVQAAIGAAIEEANSHLSRVEQIKKWCLLEAEWQPGGEELTPTMKLKRRPIEQKYAAEIDALYEG
jgi:long-subunit acyl-CoA synthetase (AMP-forming)